MEINFVSSKDSDEIRIMCTKSDNIDILMGNKRDDIIKELFKSLLQKYQEGLKESMRGSEFIFDSVNLLYYHLQRISFKRGGSYVDSQKWLKNKQATINPKNNDNNCFQYALTVALNYQNIKSYPERVSNLKPFINQYDWKEIEFGLNNKATALNILFVAYNSEKIRLAYMSKHSFKRQNQVILLMITDGKKWHHFTVKNLSVILREITSNNKEDFYCLNSFHSYSTKEKLNKHEKVCNDHDY